MGLNRPPRSVEEISKLPPLGTTEREVNVRALSDSFAAETLVYLLRETAATGNTALFEQCAAALIGRRAPGRPATASRCDGIIFSLAMDFGFGNNQETLNDFRQQCYLEMFRAILAGTTKKPFWEERFGMALKQMCIDEARKMARRLDELERAAGRIDLEEVEFETGHAVPLDEQVFGRVVKENLRAAIRRLPPRQARAAFLAWIEERPIESDDPDSVKNIMGVTGRAVYDLLCKAKARLAADPQIRKYQEKH